MKRILIQSENSNGLLAVAALAEELQSYFEKRSHEHDRVIIAAGRIGDLNLAKHLVRLSDDAILRAEIAKEAKLVALGRERESRWGGI